MEYFKFFCIFATIYFLNQKNKAMKYEKEVIEFLNIPNIPKKKWDGKKSFKNGVAVINLFDNTKAYAIASFDADADKEPAIKKVFSAETFNSVDEIYVVPSYMDEDVENMDLDDDSKRAAQVLIDEAHELESEEKTETEIAYNENPYFFPHIHNDEEALAFIRSAQQGKRKRSKLPQDHESIVMKLCVMWADEQKKKKRG